MKQNNTSKLALAGLLTAICVVGSTFSFPILGSRCAPVQHFVNVICAVLLGPAYGVGVAFSASLLRNLFGLGTLLAFPGSMFGAFLAGLAYLYFKNIPSALLGELFGTSILGGLASYPIAVLFMGKAAGSIAFTAFVIPFLISSAGGVLCAAAILAALARTGHLPARS